MEKKYSEIIGLNNTVAGMSRESWPFNLTIAENIRTLDALTLTYNEKRQVIIDKYAMRDETGAYLGVLRPLPQKPAQEGEPAQEIVTERVKNPKRMDEIEWSDRDALNRELTELNDSVVELSLVPVDLEKKYFDRKAERVMTIGEYVDANMESGLIIYLSDFGFFKNLPFGK